MQLLDSLIVAALLSFEAVPTLAYPTNFNENILELTRRASGKTASDPHILDIDCKGVEEVCEAQCMAILCFKSKAVM